MKRLALLVSILLLSGCASIRPTPMPRALLASVSTPDGTIGVFRDVAGVHLSLADQDTGAVLGTTAPSVHLRSFGGETGLTYNSFVFGLAPAAAVRVELAGLETIGGEVQGGTYVLALKQKDILASQLNWTFVSAAGGVIAQGTNVTP